MENVLTDKDAQKIEKCDDLLFCVHKKRVTFA